jgi:hypothetical protein
MYSVKKWFPSFGIAAVLLIGLFIVLPTHRLPIVQAQSPSAKSQPVESDMHEFMEYVFQPTYKRLQKSISAEPADKAGWKGIKADSLILAEAGNLLLHRGPKEDTTTWDDLSVAMREDGSKLYKAAKAKDFKVARQHYELMITKCNACHNEFAEGEHQLSP